jgi:hypothetical protein
MSTIRITKKLDSDTLVLPELRPLIGKTVEIRVSEEPSTDLDDLIDWEYHAELEAEEAADPTPPPTLEEVRAILSKIPGNLSAEIIADREDRV